MKYCIQCTDETSGETGSFVYDEEHYQKTGKLRATTRVFPDLVGLFSWARDNGVKVTFGRHVDE